MFRHDVRFQCSPAITCKYRGFDIDSVVPFIRHDPLTVWELELKLFSGQWLSYRVDSNTAFFVQFPNGRLLECLACFHAAAGRCPILLTGQRTLRVHEAKQEHSSSRIDDQESGGRPTTHLSSVRTC